MLGFTLAIEPGVFHPALFFSSRILGAFVGSLPLQGKTVLDMGTGSGILALCAARAGGRVVAVDVSPDAVRCARRNVEQNGLTERVQVLRSDLFDSLPDAQFDLVLWNPPYYRGTPRDESGKAWYGGRDFEAISRFAGLLPMFLTPGGSTLLILSSDVDETLFFSGFGAFSRKKVISKKRWFERLTVYELKVAFPQAK